MYKKLLTIITFLLPLFASAQNKTANIGETTLHFNDTLRKRPLITEVWYPTSDTIKKHNDGFRPFARLETVKDGKMVEGKFPLVMISHGTGGGRLTLEWLADALVQNGFIVAAVDHWGNTYDNKIPIDFVTPWERPQDISFVLTGLLKDPKFGPAIDQDRIGAAGFSIGGYTTIALAGARLNYEALKNYGNTSGGKQESTLPEFPGLFDFLKNDGDKVDQSFKNSPKMLKDKRIKAFFAMCPAIGQGFVSKSQFKEVDKPLYIVEVESDHITPYKTNAQHYHELIPASKFLLIKGKADHYVFLGEAAEPVKKESPVYFTDDPSVSRHQIHEQVSGLAVDFFKEKLK